MDLSYIGPWLAIGLSWLWVAIWQGILAKKAMDVISKTPANATFYLTVTILWVALVESAAIYGLVVAFQLLAMENLGLYSSIWAWLAIGLSWLGAGWWEGQLVAWALTAMDRNPQIKAKIMTFMVLFVALVEVTAIYGLIIAFKIMDMAKVWWEDSLIAVWAWLAIWLAWLWVGVWRWYLSEGSLITMGKNPKMISYLLTVSILWVALVESAAIYGLIVSFGILSSETIGWMAAIGAWLAIGLTWAWAWVWEWLLVKWAIEWINQSPEKKNQILTFMILFIALVESVAIYGLIMAFTLMGDKEVVVETPTEIVEITSTGTVAK